MRAHVGLAAAAILTGLLVAPMTAASVAVTCQGRPATIVAKPNQEVTGTDGDDVIVGKKNSHIDALAGNDVICLDSGGVMAGDGNDSVEVIGTDPERGAWAILGEGDDRYVGGPGQDSVDYDYSSPGADVVSTGAGRDTVSSRGLEPNHDVVDLGRGDDGLNLDLPAGSSVQARAGLGSDHMDLSGDSADYVANLGTGLVTGAGSTTASFAGFETYRLRVLGTGELRVVGTPRRDVLSVEAERLDVHLGDGRDVAQTPWSGPVRVPVSGVVDLGPGEDELQTQVARLVLADLVRGRLVLKFSRQRHGRLSLVGAERVGGAADRVVLRGGPGANQLFANGCHVRLSGGGGADKLSMQTYGAGRDCGAVMAGGKGRDRLSGGLYDDRLLGGTGRDVARGGPGTDTCSAEREVSCER